MKIKLSNKKIISISLLFIFCSMFLLNFLTPLLADDYTYSFGLDGKLMNLWDIIERQINHYFTWGGRSVAHTMAQFFLMYPKMLFNIFNALMYTLLIYKIYSFVDIKRKKPFLLLFTHLLIWFINPVFGQTCIWLVGSCNYLWTMVIILTFLNQYFNKDKREDKLINIIGLFLLGFISGWTNENTAAGTIAIIFMLMIYNKFLKKKFKKWQISGLIGIILGFIIMIIAPGNFVRSKEFTDNTFIILKLVKRVIFATKGLFNYLLPLLIAFIIIITIYIYFKKRINTSAIIFFVGSLITLYAMCLSPTFPERSWFGVITFAIISLMYLLEDMLDFHKIFKFILLDLEIIIFIFYSKGYVTEIININNLKNIWDERIIQIEKAKKQNKKVLHLKKYITYDRHNPAYDLADLYDSPNEWTNKYIAKYYNVEKIIGEE